METSKINIYQLFVRLFSNTNTTNKPFGTQEENGVGKFNHITHKALQEIKQLGITHIWYTGVIEHACVEDYSKYGIKPDNPQIVKGRAGSPYAIKDYYDVHPTLAENIKERIKEFEALIDRTHQEGLKAIIDFVPNHVARSYQSDVIKNVELDLGYNDNKEVNFDQNNNFYYILNEELGIPQEAKELAQKYTITQHTGTYIEKPAKATGNNNFSNTPNFTDWYETIKLNYGVNYFNGLSEHFQPIPSTWEKMKDILAYWAKKEVDGFRCDMAEMVPLAFWKWVIPEIKAINPNILFIAEAYKPENYRRFLEDKVFDYLYDKVGLYDILKGIIQEKTSTKEITKHWQNINGIENKMLKFLENHDEQRIASRHFAGNSKNAWAAMVVAATISQSPVMIYFGQEVGEPAKLQEGYSGEDGRTSIFDYCGVPNHQRWLNNRNFDGGQLTEDEWQNRNFYQKLLNTCLNNEAINQGKFYDLMWLNQNNSTINPDKHFAYLRYSNNQYLLIFANFDKENAYNIKLNITEEVFQHIQLPTNTQKEMINLLYEYDKAYFDAQDIIKNGLQLYVAPNVSYIYQIK